MAANESSSFRGSASRIDDVLSELRSRAANAQLWPRDSDESDALARALHEVDVYHAELEIQNQDLRQTQLQLSAARDKYQTLFDGTLVPMVAISNTGVVLEANHAALTLIGRQRRALVGKPLVVCLAEGELDSYYRHINQVVATDEAQRAELLFRSSLGEPRRVVVSTARIPGESPHGLLCHLNDITEQRAAEVGRERLEHRLREAEKLEAIGRVAANIAHEVNNILVSVISMGEFAHQQVPKGSDLDDDLASLLEAAWRGARLMRGLLGLSRGSARSPRPTDGRRLMSQVATMLKHKKPTVEVVVHDDDGPTWIVGDEDDLLHALLNVGTNALDSMDAGQLMMKCEVVPGSGLETSQDVVRFTFRDQGAGMSESTLARVFEPLFTTKAAVGGSGLGLTLVHKTISAHSGTIDIVSKPAAGTTVTIDLPRAGAVPAALSGVAGTAGVEEVAAVSMTVLLVDDDDRVRSATQRTLEAAGLVVRVFADGPGAYDSVERGMDFDVAVIDVNMPLWSGPDLVERLFARLGPVPVVFVTGASGDLVPEALLKQPHVCLLRKPWTRQELLEALQAVASAHPAKVEGPHPSSREVR